MRLDNISMTASAGDVGLPSYAQSAQGSIPVNIQDFWQVIYD